MSRVLAVIVLTSSLVALAEPPGASSASNAVTVRLGSGAVVGSGLGGLSGLGGFAGPATGAGLSYEHAFGHLSLVVALDASALLGPASSTLTGSLEPGVRWTFGDVALSGPFVGVAVPLALTRASGTVAGPDPMTTTPVTSTALGIGVDGLAGWSFRFDNGFFAQVAAGPRVSTSRLTGTGLGGLGAGVTLGLRAFVSLGASF